MSDLAALEITGLAVQFGDARVLDGMNLSLAAGERLALVGESGCGKSTTALAALGLLPASARITGGRVRLRGTDLLALSERQRRGLRGRVAALVPQDAGAALNPVLPAGRQVASVLGRCLGLGRGEARRRTLALFEEVGLDAGLAARRPHELSGGQCQRAMIALALGCEPDVLIADEPTSALDVTTQARVMERLLAMTSRRGAALLLITHDLALAGAYCDRGLVMYCGRVVEQGSVDAVLREPVHPYTAGLLDAVPRLRGARRAVRGIPGSAPPPDALPPGCRFEPRCPRASVECRQSLPEIGDDGAGRAACIHPLPGTRHD